MSTKYTRDLTKSYVGFFKNCTDFALAPVKTVYNQFAGPENDFLTGVGGCLLLSTPIFPILPTVAAFTFSIACIAITLALHIAPFLFIPAFLIDCMSACINPDQPREHRYYFPEVMF